MTKKIQETFGRRRVLLPVIHYAGRDDAMRSIEVAAENGASGVFLINQGITSRDLLKLIPTLTARHPSLWFGVNLLGFRPDKVMLTMSGLGLRVGGVWSDYGGMVSESDVIQPSSAGGTASRSGRFKAGDLAKAVDAVRGGGYWSGLYFGGVAHKGDGMPPPPHPDDYAPLSYAARDHMDVVTTSGPATGMPASPRRVAMMWAGIGHGHPACMGLSSGVTPENVGQYLPYVHAYLVASGIETSFGVLDPAKTRSLADAIERGPTSP